MIRLGTWRSVAALTLALSAWSGAAFAQAEPKEKPLIEMNFEENAEGWQTFGGSAKSGITTDAGKAKHGKGALAFDYKIQKGEINSLMTAISESVVSKMRSMRFWVKADYATSLIVTLQEKNGGRYLAMCALPANQWQRVELEPDDFTLTEGKDDPKDPNGKLDIDQVDGIFLSDFGFFFAQSDDENLKKLLGVKTGSHTLWLDQFALYAEPLPKGEKSEELDSFNRPQLGWLGVGEVTLSQVTGKPLTGAGLKASYKSVAGAMAGWVRRIPAAKIKGKEELVMTIASDKPTRIMVQLEETSGGKYNKMIDLPGGDIAREFVFKFSELTPADDSQDTNGKLDLDKVNQLLIIDINGLLGGGEQDVNFWLNRLYAR